MTLTLLAAPLAPHPAAAPSTPASARFWGIVGHRVVARIAAERLSPKVKSEVALLLGGQSMASVSGWADSIRSSRPATETWHYVNISVLDSSYQKRVACRRSCILTALDSLVAVVRNRSESNARRGEALRYVIHLVADLHQPLHASDRGDRGGNDLQITFLGRAMNLHTLWDGRLLQSGGESEEEIVRKLMKDASTRPNIRSLGEGTLAQWAMESHDVARDQVYATLPKNLSLNIADASRLLPIAEEQLLRGGVRLAALLERTLAP